MKGLMLAGVIAGLLVGTLACGSTSQDQVHSVGMVTLEVSGGFAGVDRLLIVDPDGTAHMKFITGPVRPVNPRQVDPTMLVRLHALVSDPAFRALRPAYLPPPGGADEQDYVITAKLDGRQLLTMTRDGADRPPILQDVLSVLNGIFTTVAAG